MAKTITLQHSATCADCGAELAEGTEARYYNARHIYGLTCHESKPRKRSRSAYDRGDRSAGARASHYDRGGVYSGSGAYLGRAGGCGCEDYPCCGH